MLGLHVFTIFNLSKQKATIILLFVFFSAFLFSLFLNFFDLGRHACVQIDNELNKEKNRI